MEEFETKIKKLLEAQLGRPLRAGLSIARGGTSGQFDVTFSIDAEHLTFDELCVVSTFFHTKLIDIDPHRSSGCETCGWNAEAWVELSVRQATWPEPL